MHAAPSRGAQGTSTVFFISPPPQVRSTGQADRQLHRPSGLFDQAGNAQLLRRSLGVVPQPHAPATWAKQYMNSPSQYSDAQRRIGDLANHVSALCEPVSAAVGEHRAENPFQGRETSGPIRRKRRSGDLRETRRATWAFGRAASEDRARRHSRQRCRRTQCGPDQTRASLESPPRADGLRNLQGLLHPDLAPPRKRRGVFSRAESPAPCAKKPRALARRGEVWTLRCELAAHETSSGSCRRPWRLPAPDWGLLVRTEYHPIAELFPPLMVKLRAEYQRWRDDYLRRAEAEPKLSWLRDLVAKAPEPQLPSCFLAPPSTCQHCGTKFLGVTDSGFHDGEYCSDRCIDDDSPVLEERAKLLKVIEYGEP